MLPGLNFPFENAILGVALLSFPRATAQPERVSFQQRQPPQNQKRQRSMALPPTSLDPQALYSGISGASTADAGTRATSAGSTKLGTESRIR